MISPLPVGDVPRVGTDARVTPILPLWRPKELAGVIVEERRQIQAAYALAIGLKNAAPTTGSIPGSLAKDLNAIVNRLLPVLGNDANAFTMHPPDIWQGDNHTTFANAIVLQAKLGQLVSYLEYTFHISENIIEIGSLYNSIKDQELKSRCSDLLSAPGNFDRVINQATLVLEDRLRTKSGIDKPLTGVSLVNAVLNADIGKTLLRVTDNAEEHEGICHICRGVMLSFRNPTHHHILDKYGREDALKLCAFIDNLLQTIDNSQLTTKS